MPSTPARYVILDCETTGFGPGDRIIELAAVTLDGKSLETIDEFDTLVNPQRDVGRTDIHGITASMVAAAPTFTEIAATVARLLDGAVPVAHNLPFDARLVRTEAALDGRTRQAFAVVEAPAPFAARHPQPLAPGLFVDAVIEAARSETFIRIPRVALRKADEVLVVSPDGLLEVRQLRPAWSDESGAYFRSGLKPGERVVTSALAAATPGQKVAVTGQGGAAGPAPTRAAKGETGRGGMTP